MTCVCTACDAAPGNYPAGPQARGPACGSLEGNGPLQSP